MQSKRLVSRSGAIGAVTVLLAATSLYGQGYQIRGSEVVVDSRQHWEHWQVPTHLVHLEPEGSVRANEFRLVYSLFDDDFERTLEIVDRGPRIMNLDSTLRINVDGNPALDSQSKPVFDYILSPGVSRVGSNPQLASNIFDNDPTTFWEPDPADPIDTWWIEVDLGRAVPLERLRLQFVEEQLGDPFLRFVLFFEQKQLYLLADATKFDFFTFIPFKGINRDRRLFVIESERTSGLLPPVEEGLLEEKLRMGSAGPEWTGRLVETIRIQITDTRGNRAEQITEEQWQALPASERGDVAYFVRDVVGREEPVDAERYAELDESRRGRQDFYRRELPRLAEIDAWGWGDNVALGLLSSGGSIDNTLGLGAPENAYDGELSTFYRHTYFDEALPNEKLVNTDMGGTVWLEQVRVISQGYHQAPPTRGYILRASSGVRDAEGRIKYAQISDEDKEKNAAAGLFQLLSNVVRPSTQARYLEFLTLKNKDQGSTATATTPGIGEFLVFSQGPPAEAILVSDIIELPQRVDLGSVSWEATTPPGTRVEIRTRTGDQLRRDIRYFDKAGGEKKTESEWKRLLFFAKGPVDTSFVPGAGWSSWSQRYEASGDRVTSPALRRYLQIEARLIADNLVEPPALNRITVAFHDPVVQGLSAEVWPRDAQVGVLDTFTIVVKPLMVEEPASKASPGFDELLVRSEPLLDMVLIDVEMGTEAELQEGEPFRRYDLRQGATLTGVDGTALEIVKDGGDSLQIRFPSIIEVAPSELASRDYYRSLSEGDEVPTRTDGTLLTATTYETLREEQKGSIMYFRLEEDGSLRRVSQGAWEELDSAQRGPVRYFRIVGDVAEQSSVDDSGVPLTRDSYAQLPARERGQVVGPARLIRLRMAATVFLHGTELNVSARRGGPAVPWQAGEAADVTELTPGKGLVLSALGSKPVLSDMTVEPNAFTPNGDGINDQAVISLSVFRVFDMRPLTLSIYSLDGRRVRQLEEAAAGGRHVFRWDGRDEHNDLVVPGLYLVQAEAHLDETSVKGRLNTRIVAVVY